MPEKKKILIVDDEPQLAGFVKTMLETRNYEVISAADGVEGLQKAESEQPHLILLDLKMPKINGMEVLQSIRGCEDFADVPVVMLSSSDSEPDAEEAYGLHVNSYLVKPLDFGKFAQLMDDVGYYWLNWNYRPKL